MKRIAFTIVYNGENHLLHNKYAEFLASAFDYWVIVEGAAKPTGSTSWCKDIFNSSTSTDKTLEIIKNLKSNKIKLISSSERPFDGKAWANKDEQVNQAIKHLKNITDLQTPCFLWQIDIDEQWTLEQIESAEKEILSNNGKTGCFLCDYYVGPGLIAKGEWGEGRSGPYRRLWHWNGELFATHEPPVLDGKNGPGLLLSPRFKHYAYYFKQDVEFKEKYYGYKNLVNNWEALQKMKIPQHGVHISKLLDPSTIHWGNTNTFIYRVC